ncbi:MAG: hypothetical protein ACI4HI_09415 [Lachnospiraceae bacterium]
MGKQATKESIAQLQKIYNLIGETGGRIETHDPDSWWTLDMETIYEGDDGEKDIITGIYTRINGDLVYDPQFTLNLKMDQNTILDAQIDRYFSQTMMGVLEIEGDDKAYWNGRETKEEDGLQKRFSSFMNTIVEFGPYLTDPKSIEKYEEE